MKPVQRVACSIVLTGLLAGCGHEPEPSAASADKPAVSVEAMTLRATEIDEVREISGTVVSEHRVRAASRLMGHIRAIPVEVGQRVGVGDVLFSVDPADIEAQTTQARAALTRAEAMVADAETDFARMSTLFEEDVVARAQLDKATLQRDTARASADAARAALAQARAQTRYATVTSPIAGVVTRKLAEAGDLAAPGQPVVVVDDPDRIQIEAQLSSDLFAQVKAGQSIEVALEGGSTAAGRVSRIVPVADPVTRTHLIKVDLPRGAAPVGAYARLRVTQGQRNALVVPARAVGMRAGVRGVFVVAADGRAHFRMIRAGETRADAVEVQAGLAEGERVIVRGMESLANGDPVRIREAARG